MTVGTTFNRLLAGVTLVLFFSVILLPCLKAEAAEWVEITRNASGTATYFIDEESIHSDGDRVSFWDKREVTDDPAFREIRGFNEINCKDLTYRTLRITGYDKTGRSISDNESGEWKHIDVTTAMAVFFKHVCRE